MKYTSVLAAGLAAGASADDWSSWASASMPPACPSSVTQTVTTTAQCAQVTSETYATTITVKAPETETVTVYANGQTAPNPWAAWTWQPTPTPVAPSSLPYGCVPPVVTSTATVWNTVTGSTVTVTKSTLFVGAGGCASTTVTITVGGSAPTPGWVSGNYGSPGAAPVGGSSGSSGWSGSSPDSGSNNNVPWDQWNGGNGPVYTTALGGFVIPISAKIVQSEVQLVAPVATNTISYTAPVYTQKPDGTYGWEPWGNNGGSGSGSGDTGTGGGDGGNGGNTGTGGTGTGGLKNSTTTPYNVTAGSPGSNVTKPILPLTDNSGCNSAGSRDQWCGGNSINTNYYTAGYSSGKTCTASLTISAVEMDLDGLLKPYIAVNGQIPGPLIECNWGDIVSVTVTNGLTENGTSFHWHGFRQLGTNNMDGVPGITECPIAPGESKTYTFRAESYGTSWYHSHALTQYGDGAYGPIIIHGPATCDYDEDMGAVMFGDLFNGTAVDQNYYNSHISIGGTRNYVVNGRNVQYDLSGGQHTLFSVEAGKKYLFRFVNSAAQNMYSVTLDHHTMQVIAADFVPIQPYTTEWLNIAIGQRYDVVIEMDQQVDSYFLRAVTQTQCPSSCENTGLGNANAIVAYQGVSDAPYYLPTSTTSKTLGDFDICQDEPLASLVPYVSLAAGTRSAFEASHSTIPATQPVGVLYSDDDVVFTWFLNNGAINVNFTQPSLLSLSQGKGLNTTLISNPITLKSKDEWVYFVIQNQYFAGHPIHLHGHDFCILGQGEGNFDSSMYGTLNFDNPMRRDTAMLMGAAPEQPGTPSGYTVIGFQTDNPGAWLMHCHIIWHVDGGLAIQWIEDPEDIPYDQYIDSQFESQCSAYQGFEESHPAYVKGPGDSGLKRRSPVFDAQTPKINTGFDDIVRRSDRGAKRFLDSHVKRRFGDHSHPRH